MSDVKFNLVKDISKASAAEQLLKNELLVDCLDKLEQSAIDSLINATTPETREASRHDVKAIKNLRLELNRIVSNGKASSKKLDDTLARESAISKARGPK